LYNQHSVAPQLMFFSVNWAPVPHTNTTHYRVIYFEEAALSIDRRHKAGKMQSKGTEADRRLSHNPPVMNTFLSTLALHANNEKLKNSDIEYFETLYHREPINRPMSNFSGVFSFSCVHCTHFSVSFSLLPIRGGKAKRFTHNSIVFLFKYINV
jgi:hypothetical protein